MNPSCHVGVVVYEPIPTLVGRKLRLCERLWSNIEVLPRSTPKELELASKMLSCHTLLIRSSSMADPKVRESVFSFVSRGSQVICIHDSEYQFNPGAITRFGLVVYVSDSASAIELNRVLLGSRISEISNGDASIISADDQRVG